MLTSNLWVEMGLVNRAMGTVEAICYSSTEPPALPIAVMVRFLDQLCTMELYQSHLYDEIGLLQVANIHIFNYHSI